MTEDCSQVLCMCVHLLNFDLGDIVEIVLVSFTNTLIHPMHMHGHSFRVVAMRSVSDDACGLYIVLYLNLFYLTLPYYILSC